MNRFGTIFLGSVICLVGVEATAQQPSRIGLRIELQGKLRTLCVPAGGSVDQVEQKLSTALVQHIQDPNQGFWTQFCWEIETYNPQGPPQGVIQITLADMPGDIAEVRVSVSVGPALGNTSAWTGFKLLEGRETSFPRGERLREFLNQRFTEVCLDASPKMEELHQRLRAKIPVGFGMANHNFQAAANVPHGLVLLPWDEFDSFGGARFKFRWQTATKIEEVVSQGTGFPDNFVLAGGGNMSCLLTKHQQNPVMPPPSKVQVYLEMSIQELLSLPPPIHHSTAAGIVHGATTIPLF